MTASDATRTATILATTQGSEISGSQTSSTFAINEVSSLSNSFIGSFAAGDVVKFRLTGDATTVSLAGAEGSGTVKRSVSVTIVPVQ